MYLSFNEIFCKKGINHIFWPEPIKMSQDMFCPTLVKNWIYYLFAKNCSKSMNGKYCWTSSISFSIKTMTSFNFMSVHTKKTIRHKVLTNGEEEFSFFSISLWSMVLPSADSLQTIDISVEFLKSRTLDAKGCKRSFQQNENMYAPKLLLCAYGYFIKNVFHTLWSLRASISPCQFDNSRWKLNNYDSSQLLKVSCTEQQDEIIINFDCPRRFRILFAGWKLGKRIKQWFIQQND